MEFRRVLFRSETNVLTTEQKKDIENQVIELSHKAHIIPPKVSYFIKGTSAGFSSFYKKTVEFNETLAAENWDTFGQTVIHEVAHMVTDIKHGEDTKPHGKEWQQTMRFFGVKPDVYHMYDTTNAKTRKYFMFEYSCTCGISHEITSIRHNRAVKGTKYICGKCKGNLSYVKDLGKK